MEGTEVVLLACDIWFMLCSREWLDLGQVLDWWLDVFLICDDFLLHFVELCVPGNDKLLCDSGRVWCFFIVLSKICSQLYSFRGHVSENPKSLHGTSCFQQQSLCRWPNGKCESCLHSLSCFQSDGGI